MGAVLVSSDMTVSSRVRSTAEGLRVPLAIALSPAELTARLDRGVRLVIFDLSQPGLKLAEAIAAIRAAAPSARIIAFGPHVDEALLGSARDAGCDLVLTNGQFHREQRALLAQYAAA